MKASSSSWSFMTIIQVVLIVLKLIGKNEVFDGTIMASFGALSWKYVLIPLWISLAITAIVIVLLLIHSFLESR